VRAREQPGVLAGLTVVDEPQLQGGGYLSQDWQRAVVGDKTTQQEGVTGIQGGPRRILSAQPQGLGGIKAPGAVLVPRLRRECQRRFVPEPDRFDRPFRFAGIRCLGLLLHDFSLDLLSRSAMALRA
jgi:hypothetical protein